MKKQLRPYQSKAIERVEKALEKGMNKQMLVFATGLGKTFTACKILEKFDKVLWLTHTEELIEQSAMALLMNVVDGDQDIASFVESSGGIISCLDEMEKNPLMHMDELSCMVKESIGVIKQQRMDLDAQITVASIQTIHRRLEKIDPEHFDIVIADECHYAASKSWFNTLNHFEPKLRLGLTATPHRLDGMGLNHIFEEIVYTYDIADGVKDQYLAEIDAIQIRTDVTLDDVKTTAGDFNIRDLKKVDNTARNNLIVDSYEKYCKGRQGIIFCVDVQHAINVAETFQRRGYPNTTYVVGDKEICPNRKERIKSFKDGGIRILTNVNILTHGFDHPDTGWIGMACPTKSLTKYLQAIGRGTRLKSEGFKEEFGQNVKVLDFVDVTSRHRLVNCWNLDKGKNPEDKIFITQEKREKILNAIRERNKNLDRVTTEDTKINLLKMPPYKISKSPKMKEPATEKQLDLMAKFGYDVENNFYTKADAAKLIGSKPMGNGQIKFLKGLGYDVGPHLTLGEFQEAKKDAIKKGILDEEGKVIGKVKKVRPVQKKIFRTKPYF